MRPAVLLAVGVVGVAGAPGVARASGGGGEGLTGRLLVSLAPAAASDAVVARAAGRVSGVRVPQIGLVAVRPRGGESLAALRRRLAADPRVRAVAVERRAVPRAASNDPALTDPETAAGTPPGTPVQWWPARMGLFDAWDLAAGEDALVAVIDSGVEGPHPDLAGKVRDTLDVDPTPEAGGPLTDEIGHGTHVASLACAATGDGLGIAGAGRDCGLLVAKTDFSDGSVAQAIVEAADRGADAIVMSFGTDGAREPPQALVDALRYAAGRDAVLVAAAADHETDEQGDPANILQPTGTGHDLSSNLGLSVTAATFSDRRASFAGRGSQISLAAYGAFERGAGPPGLLGAFPAAETGFERGELGPPPVPPCRCRATYREDSRYAYLQGTSMATAIVGGVAALVRDLNPDLSGAEVVRLLKETARRPPGSGWSPELGWGIADARAAVRRAAEMDRRAPSSRLRAPSSVRGRAVTLRWRGSDSAPDGVVVSGVARYEVWRSVGGRRAVKLLTTRAIARRVKLRPGRRYAFFTVAVDRAGNREAPPRRPDAVVRTRR
ncbi:MAG TPA: S8 family serine peptidase [Solirubrobacteraceae bacterium]|nr:S8 family serine peptidase [Solirubrobacteraceae bacterium]